LVRSGPSLLVPGIVALTSARVLRFD